MDWRRTPDGPLEGVFVFEVRFWEKAPGGHGRRLKQLMEVDR